MSLSTQWKKSSRSGQSGNCVQARTPDGRIVEVGDSKAAEDAPTLRFPAASWSEFLAGVERGEFDL